MQSGSLSLVPLQSSSQGWSDRRERRSGYRRRDEDTTLSIEEGAGPTPNQVGPSLGFLTQVAAQMVAVKQAPTGVYQAPRWRCGVCADERA